jgi:hypothetical protein
MSAYGLDWVIPPKNCAQVDVPVRHHPAGTRERLLVKAAYEQAVT